MLDNIEKMDIKKNKIIKDPLIDENIICNLVIENMTDYVFVKDKDFKIVMCNPAFFDIYPKDSHNKIIGYTTVEQYTPEDREAFLKKDAEAFEHGYSETIESIAFPDGKSRTLETIKRRFENKHGEPFILGVSRDLTTHYSMMEEIKNINQELNEFIRVSSHDLRAPLNGIFQLVEWIEEDQEPPFSGEIEENFGLIKNRVARMQNLLDDLLVYSKIGKGNDKIVRRPLQEWIHEIIAFKGLNNRCLIEVSDLEITFPRLAFDIVFGNLISNSIQHSNNEKPELKIDVSIKNKNYNIKYSDNGSGIETRHSEVIFDVLKTLKRRDSDESSGIGLSITRKAIERYQGTINLSNKKNPSSEFLISFPVLEVGMDE